MTKTRIIPGLTGAFVLAIALFPALRAEAAPTNLGAVAVASEEPTAPAAGDLGALGSIDLTVDGATGSICVQSSLSGLSGAITAAHIHTGGTGVNGPVFVGLPSTATTVSGCVAATPAQAQAILAAPNAFYFNAHTAASPGGALRGQLSASMLNAALNGSSEVPGPGDADGVGSAIVAVDTTANRACVLLSLANVDLPAAAAHIHSGVAGVAGPVVVGFTAPAGAVAASCGTASASVISGIVASPTGHYVNVHTAPFPGGAVRGQLQQRTPVGVPVPSTTAAPITTVTSTIVPIVLTPPTTTVVTPTTVAVTVAPTSTRAPATTTTFAPTTTATTLPPTTTATPATEPAPAEPIDASPTFTG